MLPELSVAHNGTILAQGCARLDAPYGKRSLANPPIFIVGNARSGTSLLRRIIGSHSDVVIPMELHYFNRYWRRAGRDNALRSPAAARSFITRFLSGPEVAGMNFTAAELADIQGALMARDPLTHGAVLGTVIGAYADRYGRARWGEKTPSHLRFVPVIVREFPTARFVCLVRDPRDVSLSWRKTDYNRSNVVHHAAQWRRAAASIQRYAVEYAHRFTTVRYEDLTADPATVVAGICEHLDLAYEPSMLDQANDPSGGGTPLPEWKLRTIDRANTMKWRTHMPVVEQKITALIAGHHLQRWGYPASDGRWSPWLAAHAAALCLASVVEYARTRDRRFLRGAELARR